MEEKTEDDEEEEEEEREQGDVRKTNEVLLIWEQQRNSQEIHFYFMFLSNVHSFSSSDLGKYLLKKILGR